jgi:hypothetical protein
MKLHLNLLARRRPKYFGLFEVLDVVVGGCGITLPWVLATLFQKPVWVFFLLFGFPVLFFVARFRVGRRAGYFVHWVNWKVRPHRWVSGFLEHFSWTLFLRRK